MDVDSYLRRLREVGEPPNETIERLFNKLIEIEKVIQAYKTLHKKVMELDMAEDVLDYIQEDVLDTI